MSAKDCNTHKLKYEASFPVCKLALFSVTVVSQTKAIIKEQSCISSLAYSIMIDSSDFRGGKTKGLHHFYQLVFKQFFKEHKEKSSFPL